MKREERLQYLAKQLYSHSQTEKELKKSREELREEFFRLLDDGLSGREHVLPVKTIEVPDAFWATTGMTKEQFVDSRFPGWKIEHCEKNITTNQTVFVLKRDPSYVPGMVDATFGDTHIRVSKEIAEYTPEIDWTTLQAERPDLFEKLAKTKVVLELDDDELERLAVENPEELATLQRHMKVREPSIKVQPRKLKDGTEDQ